MDKPKGCEECRRCYCPLHCPHFEAWKDYLVGIGVISTTTGYMMHEEEGTTDESAP